METIITKMTKLSDVVGRSAYINNKAKQEEIVLTKQSMKYSWKIHSDFEKSHKKSNAKNNEGREIVVALPNNLYDDFEKMEEICDKISKKIVKNDKDFEYAVHWNNARTNLHLHLIFSERENNTSLEPKIYKRDIFYNFVDKKLSNKSDLMAEIIHKKGEIQTDKDGNIKYNNDIFLEKDKEYTTSEFAKYEVKKIVKEVFKEYGYNMHIGEKVNPFMKQKTIYPKHYDREGNIKDRGNFERYDEMAKSYNNQVRKYNLQVKKMLDLDPESKEYLINVKEKYLKRMQENYHRDCLVEKRPYMWSMVNLLKKAVNFLKENIRRILEKKKTITNTHENIKTNKPIIEPIKAIEPIKSIVEPIKANKPIIEPIKAIEPIKSIVEPIKANKPIIEPIKAVEPIKTIVEPIKPIETPKPIYINDEIEMYELISKDYKNFEKADKILREDKEFLYKSMAIDANVEYFFTEEEIEKYEDYKIELEDDFEMEM